MKGVCFIAGIYGVGKSTLCTNISIKIDIPSYSAGDLISQTNDEVYGKNKQVKDKNKNQDLLAECVAEILQKEKNIILAGHFHILGKDNKPDALPEVVYERLELNSIVLLEADSKDVINNLKRRDKIDYSESLIKELMLAERESALKISKKLNIPLLRHTMRFSTCDTEEVGNFIWRISNESIA